MAKKTKTVAVAERGHDLLKRIHAEGGLYLTQDEAGDIVKAGHARIDTKAPAGEREGTALILLTPEGAAIVESVVVEPVATSGIEIDADVAIPTSFTKRGGGTRTSKYPFGSLEVGQSFHVAVSEDMPDPVKGMSSAVSQARHRYSEPVLDDAGLPSTELVKAKTFLVDENGKRVKEDGHYIVTGETTIERVITKQTRDFKIWPVDASDKRGAGARIGRVL